jgi:hypothetical protein
MDTIVTATVEANEVSEAQAQYDAVVEARAECATGLKTSNGLIITYANAISTLHGEGWVYLTGSEAKNVKTERALFNLAMGLVVGVEDKPLRAKCNTYWNRIRIAAGYVKEGSDTTETIDVKTLAELKTMLNRIVDVVCEEISCPKASLAKASLIDAFTKMGGDEKTLGTKA